METVVKSYSKNTKSRYDGHCNIYITQIASFWTPWGHKVYSSVGCRHWWNEWRKFFRKNVLLYIYLWHPKLVHSAYLLLVFYSACLLAASQVYTSRFFCTSAVSSLFKSTEKYDYWRASIVVIVLHTKYRAISVQFFTTAE